MIFTQRLIAISAALLVLPTPGISVAVAKEPQDDGWRGGDGARGGREHAKVQPRLKYATDGYVDEAATYRRDGHETDIPAWRYIPRDRYYGSEPYPYMGGYVANGYFYPPPVVTTTVTECRPTRR